MTADLRAALDAALGRLPDDALSYVHGFSAAGEATDPVLFVECESLRAALAATPEPAPVAEGLDDLSVALQRAGALSPSHMTYHDLARCVRAALRDGRDDLGAPDEHARHDYAAASPSPEE